MITYQGSPSPNEPIGYSDASFATDPDDRKSTSGYVFILANGPISWQSNKQTTVALSTMEAEYIALSEAAKEAKFLRHLISTINKPISGPTIIKTDSQAALEHVKNNIRHARTKLTPDTTSSAMSTPPAKSTFATYPQNRKPQISLQNHLDISNTPTEFAFFTLPISQLLANSFTFFKFFKFFTSPSLLPRNAFATQMQRHHHFVLSYCYWKKRMMAC
jgi:hypothetical protein